MKKPETKEPLTFNYPINIYQIKDRLEVLVNDLKAETDLEFLRNQEAILGEIKGLAYASIILLDEIDLLMRTAIADHKEFIKTQGK